ncbi:HEAT repeat domain-containing protein [Limnoglobus roseus]|uniref:HEAT repeat domain-containing protein n=1 Tax=Limnoglobus roseus TaxID=2598579 RepID=A0A5C1AG57_9BACT|nr:HEAT repeat domain-containing protein [Limnoglobus roseus]QEL15968.1 hypothetical protein PX52LOC_02905 [Limnoglobus roseus]
MNRRVWCASIATTVSWVGVAAAQAPPSATPAGSSPSADGPVYVMKTAGQPERRVKVVKSEKLPDGTYLTDVKDLASGVVYTLTNPAVLGIPVGNTVPAAPKPTPVAANLPATTGTVAPAPGTPRPIFGSFQNQPQQTVAKALTTPSVANPPAYTAGTPRPIFGAFSNQPQAQPGTSVMRTAAGEKMIPADIGSSAASSQGLPQARNRKTDPLLAGASTAPSSSPAAMTARTPFSVAAGAPPSVLGKILGDPSQDPPLPQPRVGILPPPAARPFATVVAQENLGAPPTMLPPPTEVVAKPAAPAAVAKAVPPAPVPVASAPVPVASAPVPVAAAPIPVEKAVAAEGGLAVPSIDPNAKPTAATGIFDSQPATTVQASSEERQPSVLIPPIDAAVAAAGPSRVIPPIAAAPAPEPAAIPPVATATLPPAIALPTPVESAPAIPQPAVAVAAVPTPAPAVEPAPRFVPPPVVDVPAAIVEAPAVEAPRAVATGALPADVQAMIEGLKTHRRPSYRMENATSLAESAYARHPDVLSALMQAARSDTSGVVRGHCISQLATVGYSDVTFLQLLDSWTNDSEPAVRRSAAMAKTKLTGR